MRKTIKDEDFLGRGIFSSRQAKRAFRGNIDFYIFFYKESESLSVDRFGFCSKKRLTQIQDKNAESRSRTEGTQRSFYGWAKIETKLVRKSGGTVQATPTQDNPYHADINLPENIKRDQKIEYAKRFASYSEWTPRFMK